MTIELLNIDCMEYMATVPDNYFDLAIVDPPYGLGINSQSGSANSQRWNNPIYKNYHSTDWDKSIPNDSYFIELNRVSKDRIIWGANYFSICWPSRGIICWDKKTSGNYSSFELAATSIKKPSMTFRWLWNGFKKQQPEARIHPTQKPTALYSWLLENYAKEGQKILDTHLGSGSSAIAAHYFGVDFVGCELDTDYFNAAKKRFEESTKQTTLFD